MTTAVYFTFLQVTSENSSQNGAGPVHHNPVGESSQQVCYFDEIEHIHLGGTKCKLRQCIKCNICRIHILQQCIESDIESIVKMRRKSVESLKSSKISCMNFSGGQNVSKKPRQ